MKTGMILICAYLCFLPMAEGGGRGAVRTTEQEVSEARRRNQQLPLPHREAMVLAEVAKNIGAREAEISFLERALESSVYGEVARIELAEVLVDRDAERAARLVLPLLERAGSIQLREAAAQVARESLLIGIPEELRASVERAARSLPRTSRRAIEAVAVDWEGETGRQTLRRLLDRDRGDLAALDAARRLVELAGLSPEEQWLVAQCFYRHALYEEAVPVLELLVDLAPKDISATEVSFLRGRCAFRLDRWSEAEKWYHRALATVTSRTRKAEIEVHLARTSELGGNLEGAIEMARRAVVTDNSDNRRLLLIRLRLRQGRRDLAEAGIAKIRSRSSRARGSLLMALNELATGRTGAALTTLAKINARPWRGPARVVAAGELARAGRADDAIDMVESAAKDLDTFWGGQARKVMTSLPPEVVAGWRVRQEAAVEVGGVRAGPALKSWAVLEIEPEILAGIRARLITARSISVVEQEPVVGGLAGDLRSIDLMREAVRWDPDAFPKMPPEEGLWTAHQFLAGGSPWLAIRLADAVWRRWGGDVPMRAYPEALIKASYPMPRLNAVMQAAESGGIDWAIVAGVAREESRWNPGVLSRVGARGLMQLMPLTAAAVAARLGRAEPAPEKLFEPKLSLELGAVELGRLTRGFDGFNAGAVAAYNAGEAQSRLWFDQCGPGCDEGRFVLTISFDATRGYTGDVLASAEVYRRILSERSVSHR